MPDSASTTVSVPRLALGEGTAAFEDGRGAPATRPGRPGCSIAM